MLQLAGKEFGRLRVIRRAEQREPGDATYRWLCECVCGDSVWVPGDRLVKGSVRSCGCLQRESRMADVTGQRYHMLTAIERTGEMRPSGAVWRWMCECGETVEATLGSVKRGYRRSCGCDGTRLKQQQAAHAREHIDYRDGTLINRIRSDKPPSNNSSGVTGVSWHSITRKWQSRITFQGRTYNLGSYDDFDDAVKARRSGERMYFGKYLEGEPLEDD